MRLLALLVFALSVSAAPAPVRSEVRLENEHVKVVENLYEPGEESPLHTHASPRVVYVLDGGELELESDGAINRVTLEPGQTVWRPAETHVVRNVGRTSVRVLETEVKAADDGAPAD